MLAINKMYFVLIMLVQQIFHNTATT